LSEIVQEPFKTHVKVSDLVELFRN